MKNLFVYRNTIRRNNGEVAGTFSSHNAAFCAFVLLVNLKYKPLNGLTALT